MPKRKTAKEIYADCPTFIPKPRQPPAMFRKDMTLKEVIEICEEDPGCGFRIKGDPRDEFYFLDDNWCERDDNHPHAPMVAQGCIGGWCQHESFWNAVLGIWRLVDLTKHPRFLTRIKEKYVGQEVTERHYCSGYERSGRHSA